MLNTKNGSVTMPIKTYRVIDGDTIEVVLEFEGSRHYLAEQLTVIPKGEVTYIIRLLDVDADKAGSLKGKIAEHFVNGELEKSEQPFVELFRGVRKPEKFQKDGFKRMLGLVKTERGDLSKRLIEHGYGQPYDKDNRLGKTVTDNK